MKTKTEQNPPYRHELYLARDFLERNVEEFPDRKCDFTSRFLRNANPSLLEVAGYYIFPDEKRKWQHVWNYDFQRKLYIDLTMDQFNEFLLGCPEKNGKIREAHKRICILPSQSMAARRMLKIDWKATEAIRISPHSMYKPNVLELTLEFLRSLGVNKK